MASKAFITYAEWVRSYAPGMANVARGRVVQDFVKWLMEHPEYRPEGVTDENMTTVLLGSLLSGFGGGRDYVRECDAAIRALESMELTPGQEDYWHGVLEKYIGDRVRLPLRGAQVFMGIGAGNTTLALFLTAATLLTAETRDTGNIAMNLVLAGVVMAAGAVFYVLGQKTAPTRYALDADEDAPGFAESFIRPAPNELGGGSHSLHR